MHRLQLEIIPGDLNHPQVLSLIKEHLQHMASETPPESVHSLDISALGEPDITFTAAWVGNKEPNRKLAGIAALKNLGHFKAEIKSMRTASAYKRMGVATDLLTHLINTAKRENIKKLYLETGSMDSYAPARSLYEKFGFKPCAAYDNYVEDPNSIFMHLTLS